MKKTMTVLFGLCLMLILSWAQASAFTGFSPFPGGGGGSSNQIGTLTDGKWCTYSSSTGKISCTEDAPAGAGDVTSVGVAGDLDCEGGACFDGTSDGGQSLGLYDGTSAYTAITAGVRTLTLAPSNSNAENMVITFGDNNNALALSSGTGATSVTLTGLDLTVAGGDITLISATAGAGVSAGDGTLTLSGLGSGTDETLTIDLNSADLITLASGTSATFAFTPAVGFTGRTTHSAGLTVADAQTIIFDESASEPDDADLVISGSDGVLTIASANGVNNENITIDLDATSNVATFNSGTSATFTLTPATTITGQLTLSANPRIYDGDSHYLTLDVADLSGAVTLALGATYTDTKWCSYSSTTGLTCNEEIPATAANDVTGVGDCASGACLDGSSDGGSYIRLYDGNSHYTSIAAGDSTGNVTVKLPTADGISGQYIKTDGSGQWSWGDPAGSGTITAVGNFSTGAAFTTDATQNGILYFEGSTANDYEIALTAANATADRTITLSDETGTVMLGPSGLGTDNRLMKTDGTGNLVQITGITVDDSDNVSGVGTFGLAGAMTISANSAAITHSGTTTLAITSTSGTVSVESITFTGDAVTGASNVTSTKLTSTELEYGGNISLDALNAAANSTITLNNSDGTYVANVTMEGDATVQGGDLVLISATAGATITGGDGTITLAGTGSGQDESLVLNFNSTADTIVLTSGSSAATINANAFSISSNGLVPDAAGGADLGSSSAEWNDLYLHDGAVIYGQADGTATLTSSASTWTASALTSTGTLTANGNTAVGDADTDTLTVRSRVIGGNSRAVWIDDDETTAPTYATATNELYVEGDVETAGNMYAASFVTGAGTDGQRRATLTSNTSFDCATYPDSVYFLNDALMFCNSTSSKTPMRLEDAQTVTGKKTFQADIAVGDASNAGSIDIYDGSSNYWVIAVPSLAANYTMTLPTDDGTSGQYLQTDGSGALSWGTPSATAAGATAGMIQYNASGTGGALAGDAGFIFTTATDKLTLGESGGSTTGTIDLYYTGTTYAATVQPNSGMAADVTLTLPSYTTTILGAGANTFTGNQTLDDGTGDSPTIVFQDATDTTMTMVKSDNAWFTMTPSSASYGLNVLTGNLKVGNNPSPGQTLNGEDAYIEGYLELDGMAYLDGGANIGTSLAFPATLSSAAAVTWTVMDDQTSGLTIGATDKADILKIISTNSGEGVSMSGTLAVTGITTFSANPRIYDGNSNYATLDTPDISGDITITLPSSTSTLAILAANTFTGAQSITAVNAAGGSVNDLTVSGTLGAMDGADDYVRGIYVNWTNADHSNGNAYGLHVANITGDAEATERALMIGTGWDHGLYSGSPVYVGDGTNGLTVSATGAQSFAGTATFSASAASTSIPWVVGTGTASNTTEGTAYWESDTEILTVGDGTNGINLDFTANTTITFPGATSTLAILGANTFTGAQAFTTGGSLNATSADSSVPMVVGTGTASGVTTAGQMYFESDTEILTLGDGATSITLDLTPNVIYTFPGVTSTLATLGANVFVGGQTFSTGGSLSAAGADSSIPMVVGTGTASGITTAGQMYFESDTEILTVGDGATSINLDFTPDTTITFPSATATLAKVDSQVFTTLIEAPYLILGSAATAADAGAIRMPNATYIMAEADAAADDISVIGVDSSEVVQIGASGATGVTITPVTTIANNNGNNAFTLLNLINNDTTTGSETGRTSDLVFSIFGSIAETTNIAHQAAKISAYQVSDFYASSAADIDSGLKFYTTNNNTPTLALTIDNAQTATLVGDMTISGGDVTLGSATGPVKGTATFYGATSGTSVLSAPDVAGSATAIVLPSSAGTLALNNQTMYIGTTSVAINRGSAALTLAGITLTTPDIGAATGTSLALGADPADAGALMLSNASVIGWEDATECTITHVDNVGLTFNLLTTHSGGITSAGDVTMYDAVNDGNPVFSIGSAAAERMTITATYESGGQLLESVTFNTTTADGDADDGEMIFQVDDVEIARFKDSGAVFAGISTFATSADPDADGGATLGTKNTAEWQNLYLNTGGTIEFENGDITLTHSANTLTLGGGDLALGSNNMTFTGYLASGADAADTGAIRLSNGEVIAWEDGTEATITHVNDVGLTFNLLTTHSGGILVADSQSITFDESAANPNDADVQISATDGVLTIIAANGDNNESLTIDLDAASNVVTLNSGTSATFTLTPATTVSGALVASTSVDIPGATGLILENDETITNSVNGTVLVTGALSSTGVLQTGSNGTDGQLTIYSDQGETDYSVVIQPHGTMTAATTYLMPPAVGTANQVLGIASVDGTTATLEWQADDSAGAPTLNTVAAPEAAVSFAFNDGETLTFDGANSDETFVTISLNTADLGADTTGLLITAVDNDDANYIPFIIQDDQDGTPDTLFKVDYQGTVTSGAHVPISADGAAIGSATAEWSDLYLADGGVINLGNDQDVTITHIPDVGIQVNTAVKAAGVVTGLMPSVIVLVPSGVHDGDNDAAIMTDGGIDLGANALIGMTVYNVTDGSSCTITANAATTITCTLAGGTDNNWDTSDVWQVGPGPYQAGSWFYVTAAGTIRHPATVGYVACYESDATAAVTVEMASDSMIFQGVLDTDVTALDAGDSIDSSGSTTGDYQCIHNKSATEAQGKGKRGTWVDGGAT